MTQTTYQTIAGVANPLWNPWCSDASTFDLYRRRCRRQVEEMTCASQVARMFQAWNVQPGESVIDIGCAGGYYYWSLLDRGVPVDYYGLDYTPSLIELAMQEMVPNSDLTPDRFILGAAEHLDHTFDYAICCNVLTMNPHYALPLERILRCTRKKIVLRESMAESLAVRYTPDTYLDAGKQHIRVYHNTYPIAEVVAFMREMGFRVTHVVDERTNDGMELVVDVPHYWRILVGERE